MKRTSFAFISAAAIALLTMLPIAQAGDAGAAKRNLNVAKMNAESDRWDDVDTAMKKAMTSMEGLSDAEKGPLMATVAEIKAMVTKSVEEDVTKRLDKAATADPGMAKLDFQRAEMRLNSDEAKAYADPAVIEKLRARLASLTGGGTTHPPKETTTTTPPPKMTNTGALSPDAATAVSRVRTATNMLEGGDPRIAEGLIRQALKLLENVPEGERAPIMADIVTLNKKIDEADLKARRAEEFRRVDEQVSRYVGTAENSIQDGVVCDPEWIDKSERLLASNDVTSNMPADRIKTYQGRLDATRAKLKIHNKTVALDRCQGNLKELEEMVASDPFKGTDNLSAYNVFQKINSLSWRVKNEFARVPKDDPEIKAVLDRVAAANAKIEAAAGKWEVEKMQEQLATSWKFTSQQFAGWQSETLTPAPRRVDGLQKTTQAVAGCVYWLNQSDTKQTIEKYKDNAIVQATAQEARKTLEEASAKLSEAFNKVVADAEAAPMPKRESDRNEVTWLVGNANQWFAGTKYKEANAARAKALVDKWEADIAKADKEMEETLKKLTAQADAAWPAIEAKVGADKGFDPANADQWKGKVIEIKDYWNRTGWDFDAHYDFAVGIKGIPVAGQYEPNVREAFNEGSRHTKFGINDHTGWDLIAVVEGPGKINRRVTTEWKDKDTHQIIMKTESLVPEPCIVLKIIGLRAGPVAVGPK